MRKLDIFLLPAIVIATALTVVVPTEFALRKIFPANEFDQCVDYSDTRPESFHAKPNCVSRIKVPESPWVEIKHNACGFRQEGDCGPKRPDSLRVAIVGSSLSAGYLVPQNETMSVRVQQTLARSCRIPVDVQNLGAEGNLGSRLYASAAAAVNLTPDVLVYVISPTDLQLSNSLSQSENLEQTAKRQTNLMREMKVAVSSLRVFYMESYLLLRNDDNYVPIYLKSGHNADFMRKPLSEEWQTKLLNLDDDVNRLSGIARRANVPLLVLYVPQRAEAAIHATPRLGHDVDGELLPRTIEQLVLAHGAYFANVTKDIPAGTPSSALFYAMNGHINGAGNLIMANTLKDGIMQIPSARFGTECNQGQPSAIEAASAPASGKFQDRLPQSEAASTQALPEEKASSAKTLPASVPSGNGTKLVTHKVKRIVVQKHAAKQLTHGSQQKRHAVPKKYKSWRAEDYVSSGPRDATDNLPGHADYVPVQPERRYYEERPRIEYVPLQPRSSLTPRRQH